MLHDVLNIYRCVCSCELEAPHRGHRGLRMVDYYVFMNKRSLMNNEYATTSPRDSWGLKTKKEKKNTHERMPLFLLSSVPLVCVRCVRKYVVFLFGKTVAFYFMHSFNDNPNNQVKHICLRRNFWKCWKWYNRFYAGKITGGFFVSFLPKSYTPNKQNGEKKKKKWNISCHSYLPFWFIYECVATQTAIPSTVKTNHTLLCLRLEWIRCFLNLNIWFRFGRFGLSTILVSTCDSWFYLIILL